MTGEGGARASTEAWLDRWAIDHAAGMSVADSAEAMGLKVDTLDTILRRARARGDQRGARPARRTPTRDRSKAEGYLNLWNTLAAEYPGLTRAEAAAHIGCSQAALTSALYRARQDGCTVLVPAPYVDPTRS